MLQRPDVPLHNNLSEGHIRDYVKKRKISGSTRSDAGRRARDTFASLKKTCRRLGVNFWEYLQDRVQGLGKIPRLADLIRQKAEEIAARKAPAAPRWSGRRGGLNIGSGLRCLVSALRLARNDSEHPMPGVFEKLRRGVRVRLQQSADLGFPRSGWLRSLSSRRKEEGGGAEPVGKRRAQLPERPLGGALAAPGSMRSRCDVNSRLAGIPKIFRLMSGRGVSMVCGARILGFNGNGMRPR